VRRALAAALCAAAGCHSQKRPPAPPPAAVVVPAPAPAPEVPPLALARERRQRILQAEQRPNLDMAAVAADALACASEAHRSWAAQFPEAAAAGREKSAALVGPAGAEALYLEAVCSAVWARMQGFTPLIERRNELVAALSRVGELAPALDGAGAERELGALYAALPAYAGGDLDLARKYLFAAVERAPDEPRNHLVLARTVAVKAQERALFREQLQIAADSGDALAAAQARALLARENDLFGPAEAAQPVPGGPQK